MQNDPSENWLVCTYILVSDSDITGHCLWQQPMHQRCYMYWEYNSLLLHLSTWFHWTTVSIAYVTYVTQHILPVFSTCLGYYMPVLKTVTHHNSIKSLNYHYCYLYSDLHYISVLRNWLVHENTFTLSF